MTVPDGDLIAELYAGSFRRLVVQLYAVTGDLSEAQEAVQEAFTKALVAPGRFARLENPEAWLRRVAVNVAAVRGPLPPTSVRCPGRHRPGGAGGPGRPAAGEPVRAVRIVGSTRAEPAGQGRRLHVDRPDLRGGRTGRDVRVALRPDRRRGPDLDRLGRCALPGRRLRARSGPQRDEPGLRRPERPHLSGPRRESVGSPPTTAAPGGTPSRRSPPYGPSRPPPGPSRADWRRRP